MTTAAETHLREYAGRCLLDGNPSDLILKIPAPLISKLPQELRDAFDFFAVDYLKNQSIDGGRILRELANGGADGLSVLFAKLVGSENIPPMAAIEERIQKGIKRYQAGGAGLEPISGTTLQAMEVTVPPMVMDPLLPAGGKGILAGGAGIGKTLLAEGLALDVGNGLNVVGRFATGTGPVIYFDAENPAQLVKARIAKIAAGKNAILHNLFFVFPKRKTDLGIRRHREDIIHLAKRQNAKLLIFDSILCYASLRNENDNTEVRAFLELAAEIPRESGAAILFIDHAPKPSAERMTSGAPLLPRGAGAKLDWCDVCMTFAERKHESKFLRVLSFPKTRWCPTPGNLLLEMDPHLIFTATEEDQVCGIWHVRTIIAESPGITTGKLVDALQAKTGASRRTAQYAIGRARQDGYLVEKKQGRETLNFPKGEYAQVPFAPIGPNEAQQLELYRETIGAKNMCTYI